MRPDYRVSTPSAIHVLRVVGENKLAGLGTDNSLRVYQLGEYALLGGFKTLLEPSPLKIPNADISPNGAFVAIFDQKENAQAVYYTKTKKMLYALRRHKGAVESCAFDRSSRYLLTGGQDGRVYLWSMKAGKLALTLPFHSDFVSRVCFDHSSRWVATGGFDHIIYVTNISSMNQKFTLGSHNAPVTRLLFAARQRLIAADQDGEVLVWDFTKTKVIHRFEKMRAEVTAMTLANEGVFLFVVDSSRLVRLYDLKNYKTLDEGIFTLRHKCYSLQYCEDTGILSFGLENGEILFFDLFKDLDRLQDLITKKALDQAYKLLEKNPVLYYTQAYSDLEQEWEFDFDMAGELLGNGKNKEAKELLAPYQVQSQKRLMTQRLFKDYSAYERFKKAATLKKYPLAYSLATQYPILQRTKYYRQMEQQWESLLHKAKDIITEKDGQEKASQLLLPFKGVAAKSAVMHSIFEQRQVISLFQKKIAEDSYNEAFLLARKHPFLQKFEEYTQLVQRAKNIEHKARQNLQEGNYPKTVRLSEKLAEFPQQKETAKQLYDQATAYAQAMDANARKDYARLYKLAERYPVLEESEIIQKLEHAWAKRVYKAEYYASKGGAKEVYRLFAAFVQIPTKLPKIAELLKLAYSTQIQEATLQGAASCASIRQAVAYYVYLFGIDIQIRDLAEVIASNRKGCKIDFESMLQIGDDKSWIQKKLPARLIRHSDG